MIDEHTAAVEWTTADVLAWMESFRLLVLQVAGDDKSRRIYDQLRRNDPLRQSAHARSP